MIKRRQILLALLFACLLSTIAPTAAALGSPVGETVYIGYDATVAYDGSQNSSSAYEDTARPTSADEKHAFGATRTFLSRIADFFAAKTAGQLGREGEAAIQATTGLSKNTQSFIVNGRTRIPDFITARDPAGFPTSLIESKNVQYQSLTRQLRDYGDLVGAGGRVDVALPIGAKVSRPLQNAFDNPNNPLFRMDLP